MSNLIFLLELNPLVDWIINIFRSLFAFFDMIFYSLITLLFRAVFNLANFELYGFYELFENRIYVILGIFMLFKVTVSMITYLVNPDKMADKEQGAAKLVTRIITVLVMLIALPTFFGLMTEAQNKLLPVIPRVITGYAIKLESDDVTGVSENMTMTLLTNFASVKDGCGNNEINSPSDLLNHVNDKCEGNDSTYKYDYFPVLSTLIGLIGCYVIFSLCISVAVRAFKLIILRMMAPIPVISYIDPKSAKDGAFSHWTKTFISTWAELFINLGLIYFIVYMIDMLTVDSTWATYFNKNITPLDQGLLLAFLIIGLLFFAKQAPQFIFDALGIKYKGNFTRMLGLGASALGMGGTVASAYKARNEYDRTNNEDGKVNHLRNLGASLFSGAAAGVRGGSALLTADKPKFGTGLDEIGKYNAQELNRIYSGSTAKGRAQASLMGMLVGQTPADVMGRRNKELEGASKALKDYKSTIESRFDGNEDFMLGYNGHSFNWLNFDKNFNAANNGDESAMQWLMSNGFSKQVSVTEEYPEEYKVQTGTQSVWDNDSGEYVSVPTYETRTRTATRTVTKNVADLDRVRAEYEKIHKEGYKQFEKAVVTKGKDSAGNDVKDSVVSGKLIETQDALKGVVVDKYNEYGEKEEGTVDLGNFEGGYSNTKASLGSVSGTQRDYTRDPKYKAAMVDAKESKK